MNAQPIYMDASAENESDSVAPDVASAPFSKWGNSLNAGFQLLPDVLLKQQHGLGLSATDLVVLLHLTMQWWFADRLPFPKSATIARRTGASPRTVQRSLGKLQKLGLVEKVNRGKGHSPAFNLLPLTERLEVIARRDPGYRDRSRFKDGRPVVHTQDAA